MEVYKRYESVYGYTDSDTWTEYYHSSTGSTYGFFRSVYTEDYLYHLDAKCTVTQTLFNNDDAWEYLVPKYTIKEEEYQYTDEDGIVYQKGTRTDFRVYGFKVVSESGSTIFDVDFDYDFYMSSYYWEDAQVLTLGDKIFLYFDGRIPDDDDDYTNAELLYTIDKNTGSLQSKQLLKKKATVSPTSVRRSENVEVTLNGAADQNCQVMVVSTNGRVMMTQSIGIGSTVTTINTSSLPSGMYIVNVNDGAEIKENCKIIVR